jgi:hypothetical protein
MPQNGCPDPEELANLAAGALSRTAWRRMVRHLSDCALCRRHAAILTLSEREPAPRPRLAAEVPLSVSSVQSRGWMSLAAALLFGAVLWLAAYLKRGRPRGLTNHLFLRIGVLDGEPLDSSCVRSAVRLAYARAGLPKHYTGTHRLRHTAATRLVVSGATAKEVADILGHADLGSTAIYAKVDLPRLQAVALPWPGSAA